MKRRTYILISFLSILFVIFANNATIAQTQFESQKNPVKLFILTQINVFAAGVGL